ncbi:MAG: dioxygenase [Anaerolineae bacterium]
MKSRLYVSAPKWLWLILLIPLLLAACSGQSADTGASQAAKAPAASAIPATATRPSQAATQPTTAAPTAPAKTPSQTSAPTAQPTSPRVTATAAAPTKAQVTPASSPTAQAAAPAAAAAAQTAPQCTPGVLTPAQTEGPYYKANPPERASLLDTGLGGTKVVVTGYVLTADCKPIPGARVDFWQADAQGQYDNSGYRLRGYQVTDANGQYRLDTVIPGLYPGRTRHIHVKITPPNGSTLTTQLYFPGEASNARDGIFDQRLLANVQDSGDGKLATYNFVLGTK